MSESLAENHGSTEAPVAPVAVRLRGVHPRRMTGPDQPHIVVRGYRRIMAAPGVDDYLALRRGAGLSPRTREQAEAALPGGWAACHAVHQPRSQVVGMGRQIGDGGWYVHVIDSAVLPQHQRRGLGDALPSALLAEVRDRAPADAYVNLLADPPGVRLYERHGFRATAPGSVGMSLWLAAERYGRRWSIRIRDGNCRGSRAASAVRTRVVASGQVVRLEEVVIDAAHHRAT